MANKLIAAVLVGLSLSLAQKAQAFTPAGDHYLCDYPMELAVYRYSRWFGYELPIKVYIPPVPYATENPGMYLPLVQQAFNSWGRVFPRISFSFVSDPKSAQIKIKWFESFPESESMWGEALFPQPYFDKQKQLRHTSEVRLAVRAQEGTGLTAGKPLFSFDELLAIATHEVGHALGLPHSRNRDDIMSAYLFRLSANNDWMITQRDADTLRYLYSLPTKLEMSPCNG